MGIFGFGRKKKKQQQEAEQAKQEQELEQGEETTPEEPEADVPEDIEAQAEPTEVEPPDEEKPEAEPEPMAEPVMEATEEPELESEVKSELEPEPESEIKPTDKRKGLFARMADRLGKTRDKIGGSIERATLGKTIDDDVLDELEEILVTADLGVKTSTDLIENLRGKVKRKELGDVEALKEALRQGIEDIFQKTPPLPRIETKPHVIMVVGINGVGKTTTIGKLAKLLQDQGNSVLMGAADTFRAAAAEQLEIWSERVGCQIVRQSEGADPSAVAFDAVDAAVSRGVDVAIIDTAGRLHTKVNLMDELRKIHRVVGKKMDGAPHEVILVLDSTTGQNALSQAKMFNDVVPLTGLVLTKLDGTAKGGVAVAIASELALPIAYVGLGEAIGDLRPFDAKEFAEAVFG